MAMLTLSAILFLTALDTGFCALSRADCGTTKICFSQPVGCSLSSAECYFVSWKKSDSGDTYEFEMSGSAGGGGSYIAIALSTNAGMQDADTYYCDGNALYSGVILTYYAPPVYSDLDGGLVAKSASTENGVAQCVLTRPRSVTKTISSGDHDFDIVAGTYHLLVASGETKGYTIQTYFDLGTTKIGGGIEKHDWKMLGSEYNFSAQAVPAAETTAPSATVAETSDVNNQTEGGDTNGNTTPTPQEYKVSRDGCGNTKTCFSHPENCELSSANCRFYSWKKLENGKSEIEMSGGAGNGNAYIALAFGTTNQMKDADLYYCDGKTIHSAVITTRHEEPTYLDDSVGISQESAWTVNGVAQCKLVRPQSVTKNISSGPHDFDLAKKEYYLLGAQGPIKAGGGVQVHTWKIAGDKYMFSSGHRFEALRPIMLMFISVAAAMLSGSVTSR